MKKLVILKSIIDFIWFVGCIPSILLLLFFSVYMFFDDTIFSSVKIDNATIDEPTVFIKMVILGLMILALVLIYCIYLFRRTLRFFQQRNPFNLYVIRTYNKIGNSLTIIGITSAILVFVLRFLTKNNVIIMFGISPYLFLVGLGLFFMILSQTFQVAKHAKEENDLTV